MAYGEVIGVSFGGETYHVKCAPKSLRFWFEQHKLDSQECVNNVVNGGEDVQVGHDTLSVVLSGQDDELIYGVDSPIGGRHEGDMTPASCSHCLGLLADDALDVMRDRIARHISTMEELIEHHASELAKYRKLMAEYEKLASRWK